MINAEDFPMGRNPGQSKPEPINENRAGDKPGQGSPGGAQKAPEHQKNESDAGRREFGRDG
jgi:hypothetical protein